MFWLIVDISLLVYRLLEMASAFHFLLNTGTYFIIYDYLTETQIIRIVTINRINAGYLLKFQIHFKSALH